MAAGHFANLSKAVQQWDVWWMKGCEDENVGKINAEKPEGEVTRKKKVKPRPGYMGSFSFFMHISARYSTPCTIFLYLVKIFKRDTVS